MIFAVAMTFIDQTIVSIAAPEIQKELGLTNTGVQWAINAYLLSLAALFAFGGRLADTVGHRKMVTLGVMVFAGSSAMCGLTPKGSFGRGMDRHVPGDSRGGWSDHVPGGACNRGADVRLARTRQGFGDLLRYRGWADGGGSDSGRLPHTVDLARDLLGEHSGCDHRPDLNRALQTRHCAPPSAHGLSRPGPDRLGCGIERVRLSTVLDLGLGQSGHRRMHSCGGGLLVVFYFVEMRTTSPLIEVSIFRIRAFFVENLVLAITMLVFVPVFFFASEYSQVALDKSPSEAGLYILYFFIGFVIAAQIGGRMLDRVGGKRPVVLGCALGAVGFWLWAGKVTGLDFGAQEWYIILAGAGMGLMLGPASTDAVNRASRLSYGEATGITQTVRNYAAGLGLAILGTILVSQLRSRLARSLITQGIPSARAHAQAASLSQAKGGSGGVGAIPHFVRLDFAYATRSVLYVMAAIMAAAAIVAFGGLRAGLQQDVGQGEPEGLADVDDGGHRAPLESPS